MADDDLRLALTEIAGPCRSHLTRELRPLTDALKDTYKDSLLAIVFYGSCLRTGDVYNGLNDFYVIVDGYRRAHGHVISAAFNHLIPTNVYYLERATEQATLRAKYAVLSLDQLEEGATHWFQSSVWGRFAQPLAIIHVASDSMALRVRAACGQAVITLLQRALPMLPAQLDSAGAFSQTLGLSYSTELRVESKTRGADLIAENADEYHRRWLLVLPHLAFSYCAHGDVITFDIPKNTRRIAAIAWPLRRFQGKSLSVLRLVKACFTFSGAIDYAAWKLERHTGEKINVTPRLRRFPLIFGWPVLWRLFRRKVVR